MDGVRLRELIAPAFYEAHRLLKEGKITHFWLPGGRGSGKSSFAAVELLLCLMRDAQNGIFSHALAVRRYSATIRESVLAQLLWAAGILEVRELFDVTLTPQPKMTFIPTGQSILTRGLDDPTKLKSLKTEKGEIEYLWIEETAELENGEKLRSVLQSVMRGSERFAAIYTFNPPREKNYWINREVESAEMRSDAVVLKSDYLSVSKNWLGERFFAEAEHLKSVSPERYRHEYLGEAIGCGREVFGNVTLREITQEEIARFDHVRRGLDWGYASDPFAYNECHFDRTRRRLYIFFELHGTRLSNRAAAEVIRPRAHGARVVCDSAEPKSIDELKSLGVRAVGAKKGAGSVSYGIKWLAALEEIIIDPIRCSETAKEFSGYCIEERGGESAAEYPDRDNHHIDAVRYACEGDMQRRGVVI